MTPATRGRLWLVAAAAVGALIWNGAFGTLSSERTIRWNLPVKTAEVRRVTMELRDHDALLAESVRSFPHGLLEVPTLSIKLAAGSLRGFVTVERAGELPPLSFEAPVVVGTDSVVDVPSSAFTSPATLR